MKKYLYVAVITALAVSSLGQAAYAHNGESNGSKDGNEGSRSGWMGKSFGGLLRFKGGIFNGNHNGQKEDKKDDQNRNRGNDDKNDNNLPRSVSGVAKVTAISGNTITAATTFKSHVKTWTILTDANTSFSIRTGGATLFSNVHVGDLIGFTGTLTSKTDSSLFVTASKVRVWGDVDLSAHVVATGTVTSIDSSATQFTIVGSDGKTVLVNSTDLSRIKDANGSTTSFANISTGTTVKVKGFWNSLKNIITAIKVKIM